MGNIAGPFASKKAGRTIFGTDATDGVEKAWGLKRGQPGPGDYKHYTEFNNKRKMAGSIKNSARGSPSPLNIDTSAEQYAVTARAPQ